MSVSLFFTLVQTEIMITLFGFSLLYSTLSCPPLPLHFVFLLFGENAQSKLYLYRLFPATLELKMFYRARRHPKKLSIVMHTPTNQY